MEEFKTIISANIPVKLAAKLKNKTKGSRSRVITRALSAYLADKEAYDITDIEIESLLLEIMFRPEISDMQQEVLRQIYLEVKE